LMAFLLLLKKKKKKKKKISKVDIIEMNGDRDHHDCGCFFLTWPIRP
jgi:hypothetical protein